MKSITNPIIKLALGLSEDEPLSKEQEEIYEEWKSGKGEALMKVSPADPRILEFVGYYDKLEERKEAIFNRIYKKP